MHESSVPATVGFFNRTMFSRRTILVLLIIFSLILPAILLYPFNADNDTWQWIASVFVRYGGLPYVAAWDHDFPGILIVHAIAIYFVGDSMLAFRAVEYVAICITIVALYRTSRLWLSETEALLGCVIFSLFYVFGRWDCMGQRDNFAVFPIVLACFYFVKAFRENDSSSHLWLIGAGGAMVGIATCIRPTHALLLAVPILTLYGKSNLRASVSALAGFIVPVLLMILPFALIPDGIYQAYVSAVRYNTDVYNHFPPSAARLAGYLHDLTNPRTVIVFVLSAVWITVYGITRSRGHACVVQSSRERSFLLLFFVVQLVGVFGQMSLSGHHFTPFFACFIPVLSKILYDVTQSLGRWRVTALAAALIVIASALYPWGLVRSFVTGKFSIESAYRYFPDVLQFAQEDSTIASYITHHTNPNEFIEVIGDPGVSWRTARRNSNAFPNESYFLGQTTEYQREWRVGYLQSLRQTSPRYIVIKRDPREMASTSFSLSMPFTPEIKDFIQANYALDTLLDLHAIYVRR